MHDNARGHSAPLPRNRIHDGKQKIPTLLVDFKSATANISKRLTSILRSPQNSCWRMSKLESIEWSSLLDMTRNLHKLYASLQQTIFIYQTTQLLERKKYHRMRQQRTFDRGTVCVRGDGRYRLWLTFVSYRKASSVVMAETHQHLSNGPELRVVYFSL